MKRPPFRILLGLATTGLLLLVAGLGACARSEYAPPASYSSEMARNDAPASAPAAPPAASMGMMEPQAKEAMARDEAEEAPGGAPARTGADKDGGGATTGEPGVDPAKPTPEKPTPAPRRKVHYDGYAKLRVTRPTDTLDQIVALATGLGGFVERLTSNAVTIRVPVDAFEDTYKKVLNLGDVLEKSVSAQDVTDALTEIGLRLETAKATRERLIALLARAQSEDEKLQLLREIQRLTEVIDRMESQIRTLESLAAFSRITVEVVQREAMAARTSDEEISEFRWIQQLNPFRREVAFGGQKLTLKVPEGLVALDLGKNFIAESADGAVFWAGKLKNEPQGTTDFWLESLKVRLEPEFGAVQVDTVGAFKVLRLEDRSENPYIYRVGVHVEGDKLELVEVYYPSTAHEQRYGAAIRASIEGGAQ